MFKLQNIRHARHVKWPIYILFGFIIISFIFFYGWNGLGKDAIANQSFARLRSESINPMHKWQNLDGTALHAAKFDAENQKVQMLPMLNPQMRNMLDQRGLLDRLVGNPDLARVAADNILLQRQVQKMGVYVGTDEIIAGLRQQRVSDQEINEYAMRKGLGDEYGYVEHQQHQSENDIVKAVKNLVIHASLYELWQEYSLAKEKLVLRMAAFPIEKFESQVSVTPKDLDDYLAAHKIDFHVPPQRRYAFVKVSKSEIMDSIKPTEAELKAYYEKNQSVYLRKAATHIEEITAPVGENGPSTVSLAVLNGVRAVAASQPDWTTTTMKLNDAHKGMDFTHSDSWVEDASSDRAPVFVSRIRALAADIKTTAPIAAADRPTTTVLDTTGAHLVRALGRRPEGAPALSEIREQVVSDYKRAKADEKFNAEADLMKEEVTRLKGDNKSQANASSATQQLTVHALAQKLKMKDELTTKVESSATMIPGIGSLATERAYLEGLQLNEMSDVIKTQDVAAVVQIVDQNEEYDPAMPEIKDKVEKAFRKSRAVDLAKTSAQQYLDVVNKGGDFDQALAKAPRPPFSTGEFTRLDPVEELGAPLIDFKQQTLKVNIGSLGMSPYGKAADKPDGYAVWKVTKLIEPKQEEFAKERSTFERDYLQVQRETIVREWLADERNKAQYHFLEAEEKK